MLLRGNKINKDNIPQKKGLYCWYYTPVHKSSISTVLPKLLEFDGKLKTTVSMRYGVSLEAESFLKAKFSDTNAFNEIVNKSLSDDVDLIEPFFSSSLNITSFTRPLYIGISNDLQNRVLEQHHTKIRELWKDKLIESILQSDECISIDELMIKSGYPHSFALQVRHKLIRPIDLSVFVSYDNPLLNDETKFDRLEKVLHWIADPVLGRR